MMQPRRAIFIHIAKTAGTSLTAELRHHYGNAGCATHGDHDVELNLETLEHGFFQNKEMISRYAGLPFISGHFGFNFCEQFMADRYAFTFLRNPAERLISQYYFSKHRNDVRFALSRMAQDVSFDAVLDMACEETHWLRHWLWNHQVWLLAHGNYAYVPKTLNDFTEDELLRLAKSNVERLSYVGFVETFQEDKENILEALGIATMRVHEPVNRTGKRPKLEDLPIATKKRLAKLTELDDELYRYLYTRDKRGFNALRPKTLKKRIAREYAKGMNIITKTLPTYRHETVAKMERLPWHVSY